MADMIVETKIANSSIRICPSCDRDNPLDSAVCANCGTALGSITVIVPDHPIGVTRTNHLSQMIRSHDDGLVLLIAAQDQPIVLKGDGKFLIGRRVENEAPPTLDLTRYGGHMLGVSRRHVTIYRSGDEYWIEDLDSANGSFVNEKRLQPNKPIALHNGDVIRLGQLMLFAYFTSSRDRRSARPSEQTIWLDEKSQQPPTHLTLQQLMSQVVPYLNAIAALQSVINDALKRPVTEIRIRQLVVESGTNRVRIDLVTYDDAIRLIQDKQDSLQQKCAKGIDPSVPKAPATNGTDTNSALTLESEIEAHPELFASYAEVAADILEPMAASLSEAERASFKQRLLVPLYTLTSSRFMLTTQRL